METFIPFLQLIPSKATFQWGETQKSVRLLGQEFDEQQPSRYEVVVVRRVRQQRGPNGVLINGSSCGVNRSSFHGRKDLEIEAMVLLRQPSTKSHYAF